MTRLLQLTAVTSLLLVHATAARADDDDATTATDDLARDDLRPPGTVTSSSTTITPITPATALPTPAPWGGGVRVTGLSGIGALPGVNYGGEVAAQLRHNDFFAELGLGWWKPQKSYLVTSTPQPIDLELDVWTVRAGWSALQMPLRAWVLGEVGELAGGRGMPGVVARMMMGDVPKDQRWQAVGAGFGVAWPVTEHARLFGMIELAVPLDRQTVMLDQGPYRPDSLVARSSAGLEVGWR